jgi:hypothetical protein
MKKLLAVLAVLALAGAGLAQDYSSASSRNALQAEERFPHDYQTYDIPGGEVFNSTLLVVRSGLLRVFIGGNPLAQVLAAGQWLFLKNGVSLVIRSEGNAEYALFTPDSPPAGARGSGARWEPRLEP